MTPADIRTTDASEHLLEQTRELVRRGAHAEALALLEAEPLLSPELEHWRGLTLIFLDRLDAAQSALTGALTRGYRGAIAGLATLQRLRGEPRPALLELSERDLDGLGDFDRANLEREIGVYHHELGELEPARLWLERAWITALIGPFGAWQLAGIALALGAVQRRLGLGAQALATLDEGLRRTRADQRVPLLLERAQVHLNHGDQLEAEANLEELSTFVADRADLKLLHRRLEAQLAWLRGEEALSRQGFQLVAAFAAGQPGRLASDVHFYCWLSLARLETDASRLERVPAILARLEGLADQPARRA